MRGGRGFRGCCVISSWSLLLAATGCPRSLSKTFASPCRLLAHSPILDHPHGLRPGFGANVDRGLVQSGCRSFLWVVVLDSRTPTPTRASLNTGAAGLVDKPLDPSGIDAHPSPSGRLTLPSTFVNTGRSHAVAPCRTRTRGGCDARRPSDGRPAEGARVKRERPRAPPTIPQHGEARAQAAVGRRARAGGVHHALPLLQPVPGRQGAFVRSLGWG